MSRWLVTTLLLVGAWVAATLLVIALEIPGPVARPLPYLAAGLVTGALVDAVRRRDDIIAIAVLALVSAIGWTAYSSATMTVDLAKALQVFAIGLPIHALAAAWAYLGLYLARYVRTRRAANADEDPPHLRALEDELRNKHGLPRDPNR